MDDGMSGEVGGSEKRKNEQELFPNFSKYIISNYYFLFVVVLSVFFYACFLFFGVFLFPFLLPSQKISFQNVIEKDCE